MTKYTLKTSRNTGNAGWDETKDLDSEQREVVFAPPGAILVVAGAGTGKTRALTYRVAHLIRSGTPPENILLCTFTNRAAREMVGRVENLTGISASCMWAGTFHHVANRLLREFGEQVGLSAGFGILDREDSKELLSVCMDGLGKRTRYMPQPNVVQSILSLAANSQVSLEGVIRKRWNRFADKIEIFRKAAETYSRRKAELNVVDFDDLLLGWLALMCRAEDAAQTIGSRFHHVLVDEYQDVNPLQAVIVDETARRGRGNLTVVGDDAQSIYSFRGASVDIMLGFMERHPEAALMKLQKNYRSLPGILKLANVSIQGNRCRIPKLLCSAAAGREGEGSASGTPVNVVLGTVEEQSCFVCQRLLEIHREEGVALRDIAVLYRAHSHSLELQVELGKRGIPFSVRSGLRFFEQAHIKDVVSFLRILQNPADELALARVFNTQRGLGGRSAASILESLNASRSTGKIEDVLMNAAGDDTGRGKGVKREALLRLSEHFRLLRSEIREGGVKPAMLWFTDGPYREHAERNFSNAEERLEDIRGLAEFAVCYDDVDVFLGDLSLAGSAAAVEIKGVEKEDDRLTLSTVHQAKGLEWRVVFVICLCDGMFPSALSLKDPEGEEEERRLFHVASTRAKEHLYLCRPAVAQTGNDFNRILRPSRFLTELQPNPPYETWEIVVE